ncbi:MAG: cytochrome c biogenesis protein CcsA, partial [Planctomycetota bacterium]
MANSSKTFWGIYWLVVVLTFAATITMLFVYTPVEATMGTIQKIFYLHLPSAINAFVACLIAFIAGIGYLWQRQMKWDDLSAAAAKIAALMCTVVLLTGMIWGRYAWGKWWVWSPRLTFSLLLWLLYVVYLIIRPSIESPQRRAMICAVYAVAAFLD